MTKRLLETIDNPQDLKRLPADQLPQLAQEVRDEILNIVSSLGGHLASSLGAVELCIALHRVFDTPDDQLVWDMGYQAYTHKLLTGRREGMWTLKQYKGLSGFCNKDESPYDLFTTGHGGTCLSTAMGLAMARDQAGKTHQVVALIGDASLGEGMALEALNHIGHVKPNMLVILNDNKMSIAKPVGGLSRYLNRVITNPLYNKLHHEMSDIIKKLPKGARLVKLGRKMEESVKGFLVPGLIFEELGLRYVGPIDGHDFNELTTTLTNVRKLKGPILLHIQTVKGKGYAPAERDPEWFHKVEAFDLETGQPKVTQSKKVGKPRTPHLAPHASFTDTFSDELVRLAETDERIIGITAAMPEGTGLGEFGRRFPERYVDVGMAEQHAVGLAAGLARAGHRPVVAVYSTFLQRAFDQIMHEMCLQNLPVLLMIDRGGLVGEDGPTHHGAFDVAYLRMLPNMTVLSPKDPDELRLMLRWAMESSGPVAIRYTRGGIIGEPLGRAARIVPGKAELLRPGHDVALVAMGSIVYPALEVANRLKRQGLEAAVVNARFIKPLDRTLLRQLATQTKALVTIEESAIAGGFGSAVSEALDAMGVGSVPLYRIGLPDQFVEHGKRSELLKLCQLDADGLTRQITTWLKSIKLIEPTSLVAEPAE